MIQNGVADVTNLRVLCNLKKRIAVFTLINLTKVLLWTRLNTTIPALTRVVPAFCLMKNYEGFTGLQPNRELGTQYPEFPYSCSLELHEDLIESRTRFKNLRFQQVPGFLYSLLLSLTRELCGLWTRITFSRKLETQGSRITVFVDEIS